LKRFSKRLPPKSSSPSRIRRLLNELRESLEQQTATVSRVFVDMFQAAQFSTENLSM
jgi:hypothetical protein